MTTDPYRRFVKGICKDSQEIYNSLDPVKAEQVHYTMGIAGESGEITDQIKKHVIYGKELDKDNIVEECGDILFYVVALLDTIGVSLEECKSQNFTKLAKRYPTGYSDTAAMIRADKLEN